MVGTYDNEIFITTLQIYNDWSILMVTSATLSVDTFFLLSGFLMSYLTLKEFKRSTNSINPLSPFFNYLHRYIRWHIRLSNAHSLLDMFADLTKFVMKVSRLPRYEFNERVASDLKIRRLEWVLKYSRLFLIQGVKNLYEMIKNDNWINPERRFFFHETNNTRLHWSFYKKVSVSDAEFATNYNF